MMFNRNPDRANTPKPWTSGSPPRPFSRRVLDRPTLIGLAVMAVGLILVVATHHWLGSAIVAGATVYLGWYCVRDIVRVWQERRWLHSAGPDDTLDDL